MPIQYEGILDEALAVRSRAGLFDVSHMGRVHVEGPAAGSFLNSILSIDVPRLRLGRGRYNVICDQQGGIIDDCIVYRRSEDRFLVIPNASNTAAVLEWFERWVPGQEQVRIENVTASCEGSDPAVKILRGRGKNGPDDVAACSDISNVLD